MRVLVIGVIATIVSGCASVPEGVDGTHQRPDAPPAADVAVSRPPPELPDSPRVSLPALPALPEPPQLSPPVLPDPRPRTPAPAPVPEPAPPRPTLGSVRRSRARGPAAVTILPVPTLDVPSESRVTREGSDPVESATTASSRPDAAQRRDTVVEEPDAADPQSPVAGTTTPVEPDSAVAPRSRTVATGAAAPDPVRPSPPPPIDTSEERVVSPGQRFSVELPGLGWIFLGRSADAVEYLGREAADGRTRFTFRRLSEAPGPVDLGFESRDLSTGAVRRHTEMLAAPEQSSQSEAGSPASDDGGAPGERHETTVTDRRSPARTADEPIGAAGDGSGDAAQDASDTLASPDPVDRAVEALLAGRPVPEGTASGDVLARAEDMATDQPAQAVALYRAMLDGGVGAGDTLLFRLAGLLERDWDGRDLRRARDLYRRVVDEYPLSGHWDAARERIEYLNRHFFYIR